MGPPQSCAPRGWSPELTEQSCAPCVSKEMTFRAQTALAQTLERVGQRFPAIGNYIQTICEYGNISIEVGDIFPVGLIWFSVWIFTIVQCRLECNQHGHLCNFQMWHGHKNPIMGNSQSNNSYTMCVCISMMNEMDSHEYIYIYVYIFI